MGLRGVIGRLEVLLPLPSPWWGVGRENLHSGVDGGAVHEPLTGEGSCKETGCPWPDGLHDGMLLVVVDDTQRQTCAALSQA